MFLERVKNFVLAALDYVDVTADDAPRADVWLGGEIVGSYTFRYIGPRRPLTPGLGLVEMLVRTPKGRFVFTQDDEIKTIWKFGFVMWSPKLGRFYVRSSE